MIAPETTEQQSKDSEAIFKLVSQAAENLTEAKQMVLGFYVPDRSYSRAGISHALKRLEQFYGHQFLPNPKQIQE